MIGPISTIIIIIMAFAGGYWVCIDRLTYSQIENMELRNRIKYQEKIIIAGGVFFNGDTTYKCSVVNGK